MRIAKYPAQSNAAPIISLDRTSIFKVGDAALNNFVNEVMFELFAVQREESSMKQTSISKVFRLRG